MPSGVDLLSIYQAASTGLADSDTNISTGIATLSSSSSASDLMKLQAYLTINSVLVAGYTGSLKERGDCLKGVTQKFG